MENYTAIKILGITLKKPSNNVYGRVIYGNQNFDDVMLLNGKGVTLFLSNLRGNRFSKKSLRQEGLKDKILVKKIAELLKENRVTPQDIANTFNGLAQLGYTIKDLEGLNGEDIASAIKDKIREFNSQGIANTFNGLAKLGYTIKDLKGLNGKDIVDAIKDKIREFTSQHIANTFNGLAQLGYTIKDLKGLNGKDIADALRIKS